jgi:hypothetical protein
VNPLTAIGPAALYNCLLGISTEGSETDQEQDRDQGQPEDAARDGAPENFTRTGGR